MREMRFHDGHWVMFSLETLSPLMSRPTPRMNSLPIASHKSMDATKLLFFARHLPYLPASSVRCQALMEPRKEMVTKLKKVWRVHLLHFYCPRMIQVKRLVDAPAASVPSVAEPVCRRILPEMLTSMFPSKAFLPARFAPEVDPSQNVCSPNIAFALPAS